MSGTGAREAWSGCATDVAAALELVVATGDVGDGFGVGDVLFLEDARGEGIGVVGVEDGDGALEDDGTVVEVLVDEVDGAAGDFDAVVEGLVLGVEAGEGGQQGGMDVDDAVGEGVDELRREQAHVAGEDDEIDIVTAEAGDDVGVVLGAGAALGEEDFARQAELATDGEAAGRGGVGDDDGNLDAGQTALTDAVVNRDHVGAATGDEDAEAEGVLRWSIQSTSPFPG